MGAPTPSLAAGGRHIHSGGSLTRYLGNLYRTLGALPEAFKSATELRRTFTPYFVAVQNFVRCHGGYQGLSGPVL